RRRRPGCATGVMRLSLMIVDNLNFKSVAVPEFETDPPSGVHGHRPLAFPPALELVKSKAVQRAQILKPFRDVQCQEKIDRLLEIQSAELVRPTTFPHLSAHRISPGPDHGDNILRAT